MYKSLFSIVRTYWGDYGGFREWISSPFLHLAVLITILYAIGVVIFDWRGLSTSSLPTMLGFSLAAYTITFTLMGSALHRALSAAVDKETGIPLIRTVNATFFHIVLFQSLALLDAITTQGTFFWDHLGGKPGFGNSSSFLLGVLYYGGDMLGCFLITYSLLLLFSVGFAMFRLGRLSSNTAAPKAANSNQIPISSSGLPAKGVTHTLRFAFVRFVAKTLRLCN